MEDINKIVLRSNNDKRTGSIDSIETFPNRTSRDQRVSGKEEIKCNNIIKRYKNMINFDDVIKEETKEHNPNWPQIPDHPYRILIIGGSVSGKYQFLINKQKSTDLKYFNNSKAFIEHSNNMESICINIEEFNSNKKHKILFVFDDMIADMLSKKNLIQ